MTKTILVMLVTGAAAFASGTITPGARPGALNTCPSESIEGKLTRVDVESREVEVDAKKKGARKVRVSDTTYFRIPGAKKEDLKENPIRQLQAGAEAKVTFCKDSGEAVEIKVKK